jgi:RNA polymerase sigma factor (TIGR02999 family)
MNAPIPVDMTALIGRAGTGDRDAMEVVFRAVFDELRRMAAGLLRGERPDHTLQPTALVNEAMLRFLDGGTLGDVPSRRYFFAACARAMRQILVNHALHRRAAKRLGRRDRVPLDDLLAFYEEKKLDVIDLDEAVERLSGYNERQGLVVSLRFFAGMSVPEVAAALGVSVATVEGDWRLARAWLKGRLAEEGV